MARGADSERVFNLGAVGWVAVAALIALALGGLVFATGLVLGGPFVSDEGPSVHRGGLEAPVFANVDALLISAKEAGVECAEPRVVEDPYEGYAEDQVYPQTEALRCTSRGAATFFYIYPNAEARIDVYEQGVIQVPVCRAVSQNRRGTVQSVAGANWRVVSVGADNVSVLVEHFDGQAIREPLSCEFQA
ncbi:hypothetical protein NHL50_01340 [Acidimicrobiia bacterium EGI L10123]|uniref:hypothetical protein n=1 Tax=Salinilacustrithrix flava TaxID=2957203 RepID=UPI003D7C2B0D|nr:hypothetical protein [Acidimicrobiia bacterium EGI L10123]